MKILISDYEGTLKRFNRKETLLKLIDLKKDLRSIDKFIKKGNIFIISTKRMYEPIKKDIEKYKIKYNYLTVGNGLITLDNKGNVIYSDCLSCEDVNILKEIIKKEQRQMQIQCYNEKGEISNFDENIFSMIRIKFKNNNDLIDFFNIIKKYFFNINVNLNESILWLHNNTNKDKGIEKLLTTEELKNNNPEIYTVGDSISDANMLINYDGFAMKNSEISILYDTNRTIPNIRKLIKKIK